MGACCCSRDSDKEPCERPSKCNHSVHVYVHIFAPEVTCIGDLRPSKVTILPTPARNSRVRLGSKPMKSHGCSSRTAYFNLEDPVVDEWQVVHEGGARVHKSKNTSTEEVASKPYGAHVRGKAEGEWLELASEPGYMRVGLPDGKPQLQRSRDIALDEDAVEQNGAHVRAAEQEVWLMDVDASMSEGPTFHAAAHAAVQDVLAMQQYSFAVSGDFDTWSDCSECSDCSDCSDCSPCSDCSGSSTSTAAPQPAQSLCPGLQ